MVLTLRLAPTSLALETSKCTVISSSYAKRMDGLSRLFRFQSGNVRINVDRLAYRTRMRSRPPWITPLIQRATSSSDDGQSGCSRRPLGWLGEAG